MFYKSHITLLHHGYLCFFRLNALNYRDLKAKLQQPITAARDVMIKQSLDERFVLAFQEHVETNPKFSMTQEEKEVSSEAVRQ